MSSIDILINMLTVIDVVKIEDNLVRSLAHVLLDISKDLAYRIQQRAPTEDSSMVLALLSV